MLDKLELSELISAKFCHDLAGPLGAINNSVEFLNDENLNMQDKAYQLIDSSSKQAIARLQFYRQAYGISSKTIETNLSELKVLIENFLNYTKLRLNWSDQNISNPELHIGQKFSKILLNIIMLMQNILIHGGEIVLNILKTPDGIKAEITGVSSNWKFDAETENILENKLDDIQITTKNIQIYYTNELVLSLGGQLKIEKNSDNIKFILEYIK